MAKFRLGCVPYVNAAPLVWWFESQGEQSPAEIVYEVPSRLPALLESGEVDAILVSSIHCLKTPNLRIASGVGITSSGPVESVRILSSVPYSAIRNLALDASSMTSNLLAQIILKDQFGAMPSTLVMEPDAQQMLDVCDACVLIGDTGMTARAPGPRVLDLGEAWTDATGLPFVWALWTGGEALTPELSGLLSEAYEQSVKDDRSWQETIQYASTKVDWSLDILDRYLSQCVTFRVESEARAGFQKFSERVRSIPGQSSLFPLEWVKPDPAHNAAGSSN